MTNHDESTVARERDPVCGMSVRTDVAREDGLVAEHGGHTSYFCRTACRDAFVASPQQYVAAHHAAEPVTAEPVTAESPEIDAGMRLWYESCSCCLSDAHPEIKAALDAERAEQSQPPVDPGICEVAEAG